MHCLYPTAYFHGVNFFSVRGVEFISRLAPSSSPLLAREPPLARFPLSQLLRLAANICGAATAPAAALLLAAAVTAPCLCFPWEKSLLSLRFLSRICVCLCILPFSQYHYHHGSLLSFHVIVKFFSRALSFAVSSLFLFTCISRSFSYLNLDSLHLYRLLFGFPVSSAPLISVTLALPPPLHPTLPRGVATIKGVKFLDRDSFFFLLRRFILFFFFFLFFFPSSIPVLFFCLLFFSP